ncbi:capsid cement protein [Microbacterium sp. EST19A]|uniref:capsid cement protein n=1 Tax=Microbacterium sp. EST19A TaxID=2862681 RepID=UPI001CBB4394|nr:capsid cement protein [Microbacterium sp. EST19A]
MPDYLPKFTPGSAITFTASADVTGGRLVQVTGNRLVGPAVADSASVVGVAAFDAEAGDPVTVYTRAGGVHPLIASGAIAAGARVSADTGGRVKTAAAGDVIGWTLTSAASAGSVVEVCF